MADFESGQATLDRESDTDLATGMIGGLVMFLLITPIVIFIVVKRRRIWDFIMHLCDMMRRWRYCKSRPERCIETAAHLQINLAAADLMTPEGRKESKLYLAEIFCECCATLGDKRKRRKPRIHVKQTIVVTKPVLDPITNKPVLDPVSKLPIMKPVIDPITKQPQVIIKMPQKPRPQAALQREKRDGTYQGRRQKKEKHGSKHGPPKAEPKGGDKSVKSTNSAKARV